MEKTIVAATHAFAADGDAPDWVHLIPAGTFNGMDGRGPYVLDAAQLVAEFEADGRKLPIDENHAIDLLGSEGGSTPARGWIVAIESRVDGIWGKVEWTDEGRDLVNNRAYGFLSPVYLHSKSKPMRISKILRAALTNNPNLTTLTSLHNPEEIGMDEEELRALLGLPETANKDDILAAVKSAHAASTGNAEMMTRIAEAAGTDKTLTGDALITAIQARGSDAGEAAELRTELNTLQTRMTDLVSSHAKERAVAAVEDAIEAGKFVPALRDHYIDRHVRNPEEVDKEIAAFPSLHAGGLGRRNDQASNEAGLTGDDERVIELMGVDAEEFAKTKKQIEKGAG